jgi:hypothetical protein
VQIVMGIFEFFAQWLLEGRMDRAYGGYERGTKRLKPYAEDSFEVQRRLGNATQEQPCKPCDGRGHAPCLAVGCDQVCGTCHGTGHITCARCAGQGRVIIELRAA